MKSILLLAALVFAAYAPGLRSKPPSSDAQYGVGAAAWTLPRYPPRQTPLRPRGPARYRMDLSVFWLVRDGWGFDPAQRRVAGIALHIFNTVVLFLLLGKLRVRGAWPAAAIFALFPGSSERVLGTGAFDTAASVAFSLAALSCYLRFLKLGGTVRQDRAWLWYLGALGLFAWGLGQDTCVWVLPAALVVLQWRPRGGLRGNDLLNALPFLLLGLAAAAAAFGSESASSRLLDGTTLRLFYPLGLCLIPAGVDGFLRWLPIKEGLRRRILDAGIAAAAVGLLFVAARSQAKAFGSLEVLRREAFGDGPSAYRASNALGMALVELGRPSESLEPLRRAEAINDHRFEAHVNLGIAFLALGQLGEAEKSFRRASELNPESEVLHADLGKALALQGLHDEALSEYRLALMLQADFDALFPEIDAEVMRRFAARHAVQAGPGKAHNALGLELAQAGAMDDAAVEFRQVVRLEPDFAEGHNNLGGALAQGGKLSQALVQYREALRLNPKYWNAAAGLGLALAAAQEYEEAEKSFAQALSFSDDKAMSNYILALRLAEQENNPTARRLAIEQLRQALSLRPRFTMARKRLAELLRRGD